jgi:hypothetical protein
MRRVCVLYEDQRGPTRGFGLHELVKACVRDSLKDSPRREVDGALDDCRPMKGMPKLLNACRQDIDLIAGDGRSVIPKRLDSALKKSLLDRDAILNGLTVELKRPIRDCIQEKMPSFRALVELLSREIVPRSKARGRSGPSGRRSRSKTR